MNTPDPALHERIKQIRLEVAGPRGKAAFARQLGISPTTYQSYERDRVPPADLLVKMADVAQVDLKWLLTGAGSDGQAPRGDHPALQRAAALLSRCPHAAAPLAAFVEILSASMSFPAKPAAADAAEPPTTEPSGDSSEHAASPGDPNAWIPILGRSAAGVPCFWADDDDARDVVTLGELVGQHVPDVHETRPARADVDGAREQETVQLILLPAAEAGRVVEFVSASDIKARYPDAFAVRIDGQSMAPEIRHGDVVVLSPTQAARDGQPAVVQLRRQIGVTCKLLRRDGESVHLVPINEQFPPQRFDAADLEWSLRVLARVRAT